MLDGSTPLSIFLGPKEIHRKLTSAILVHLQRDDLNVIVLRLCCSMLGIGCSILRGHNTTVLWHAHLLHRRWVHNRHGHSTALCEPTPPLAMLLAVCAPVQAAVDHARVERRVLEQTQGQMSTNKTAAFNSKSSRDWVKHAHIVSWQRNQWTNWTLRWYFLWSSWRKMPVYVAHNHQLNTKPSPIRNDVLGSTPWNMAVRIASVIPPSTNTAWQTQGVVQGMSSLRASTLRPNSTQGQNNPVRPSVKINRQLDS